MRNLMRTMMVVLGLLACNAVAAADYGHAVVVRTVVYPGQVIGDGVVRLTPLTRPVPAGMNVVQSLDQIVGKVAIRTLLPDHAIRLESLKDAPMLEAGDTIPVSYQSGALSITITALALQDGYIGSTVQLRNPTTGKTFIGVMEADGTATVLSP